MGPRSTEPGWQAWALLAGQSLGDFLQLLKLEAELAFRLMPGLVGLSLARIPLLLLTWLSFGILAASVAYTLTGMILAATATFFALQLIASLVLEARLRRMKAQSSLPESRKALALVINSVNAQLCGGLAANVTAKAGDRHAQAERTPE